MAFAGDLRRALEQVRDDAQGRLDEILPTRSQIEAALAGNERAARLVAETLHDLLPGLLETYRLTAATIAADLYDMHRDTLGIPGTFTPDVPDVGDGGAHALIGWATSEARTPSGLQELIAGGFDRRLGRAANLTITSATVADPMADGWQRQARPTGCPFCQFLAGRGAVYAEATADFSAHDWCHCVATIAWRNLEKPVKPYEPSLRYPDTPEGRAKKAADQRRALDWIATH